MRLRSTMLLWSVVAGLVAWVVYFDKISKSRNEQVSAFIKEENLAREFFVNNVSNQFWIEPSSASTLAEILVRAWLVSEFEELWCESNSDCWHISVPGHHEKNNFSFRPWNIDKLVLFVNRNKEKFESNLPVIIAAINYRESLVNSSFDKLKIPSWSWNYQNRYQELMEKVNSDPKLVKMIEEIKKAFS